MAAPSMDKMGERPTLAQMRDFLHAGIKMMTSDATRQLLKELPSATGPKLVELQRSNWDVLGIDQDIGCQALDSLEPSEEPGEKKDIFALKQEFVWTAMRTYLQSLEDKKPAKLETEQPMSRETIVEFFNSCNTKLDLPEVGDFLIEQFETADSMEKRGKLISDMQKKQLEILGFESAHGCAMLERIPKDFAEDKQLHMMMQGWQMKAQSTFTMVTQIVIRKRMKSEMDDNPEFKASSEEVEKMSQEDQHMIMMKVKSKVQNILSMPSQEERKAAMAKLQPDERKDLLKGMAIVGKLMSAQAQQTHQSGDVGGGAAASSRAAPAQQEMM